MLKHVLCRNLCIPKRNFPQFMELLGLEDLNEHLEQIGIQSMSMDDEGIHHIQLQNTFFTDYQSAQDLLHTIFQVSTSGELIFLEADKEIFLKRENPQIRLICVSMDGREMTEEVAFQDPSNQVVMPMAKTMWANNVQRSTLENMIEARINQAGYEKDSSVVYMKQFLSIFPIASLSKEKLLSLVNSCPIEPDQDAYRQYANYLKTEGYVPFNYWYTLIF